MIALAVMPFASINAQDARNRVTSTIIADALATLPAETPEAYNKTMDELAKTGAEGIETICAMLRPAAEGVNNSAIEYALYGTAAYVTKDQAMRAEVRKGLKNAFAKINDKVNKAFKGNKVSKVHRVNKVFLVETVSMEKILLMICSQKNSLKH